MSKKENEQPIPQHEIDAIARCMLPDILAFYESEEGQKEFEEWKNKQNNFEKLKRMYIKLCHILSLLIYFILEIIDIYTVKNTSSGFPLHKKLESLA